MSLSMIRGRNFRKTDLIRLGWNFENSFILHKYNVCEKDFWRLEFFFTISMSFPTLPTDWRIDTTVKLQVIQ